MIIKDFFYTYRLVCSPTDIRETSSSNWYKQMQRSTVKWAILVRRRGGMIVGVREFKDITHAHMTNRPKPKNIQNHRIN